MTKENMIGTALVGATVGLAIYKYLTMNEDEKTSLMEHLKKRTHELLEDTEGTLGNIKHHFAQIDTKETTADKFAVLKKLITDLFGDNGKLLTMGN